MKISNMFCRKTAVLLATSVFLLAGCATAEPIVAGEHPAVTVSAWAADWEAEAGLAEYKSLQGELSGLASFAAFYDTEDELQVSDDMEKLLKAASRKEGHIAWLTVVNDVRDAKGRNSNKDKQLLERIFADEASMEKHIDMITDMAEEYDCLGVDLDFENIWKDEKIVPKYLDFTYKLSSACIKRGLKLRIVLEPRAKMDAAFCKGPEYVVMLYNLYGTHSGPGPKADGEFIRKTLARMDSLPGSKSVALSTGGCLWEDVSRTGEVKGKKKFITEDEARKLQEKHRAKAERDPGSAALHFSFEEQGKTSEVWYADSETLEAWITVAANGGAEHIALWRLGGNPTLKDVNFN